jgi:3-oxoadipate enol-lactonase
MPKIKVRDIEVNYEERGKGFPLVLIHGLNGDLTGWVLVVPELAKHYRTIVLDVRGHGQSGKPDLPYSIPQFAVDLHAFLDRLQILKAHILGLSMGGAIAQQYALLHPERIQSLILVSTFSHVDPQARKAFGRLKEALRVGGYPALFDEVVKLAFTPQYIAENSKVIAELRERRIQINDPKAIGRATEACLAFDLKDEIRRISLPTLVVSGREDVFTPLHLAEQIHRSIQGSEWKIIEGAGHNLYIEKAPELLKILLEFLSRQ